MMTKSEQLIEAVIYANEIESPWWEQFNSEKEALKILKVAKKESPDDDLVVCLLESCDSNMYDYNCNPEEGYKDILSKLEEQLISHIKR